MTSLAFRTDLAILQAAGSAVTPIADAVVVRTPSVPDYHWGNFLLAADWPVPARTWLDRFEAAFPEAQHRAIGVDRGDAAPAGVVEGWLAAGGEVEHDIVLTAPASRIRAPRAGLPVRMLRDDEFAEVPAIELEDAGEPPTGAHAAFLGRKVALQHGLVETGAAAWFGAFDHGRLAATLGIADAGDGFARYQDVGTLVAYRRRGLASALLAAAARFAGDAFGAETVVIVADPDGDAIRLYERLGFRRTELQTRFTLPGA